MSKTVNIHQAKTHLSRLIEEALAGEEIIIAKAGKAKVRLAVVSDPKLWAMPMAGAGCMAGQLWVADDAFAEPPPDEIALWEPDAVDPR
jgi:prevent-host-death family protein